MFLYSMHHLAYREYTRTIVLYSLSLALADGVRRLLCSIKRRRHVITRRDISIVSI